MDYGSQGRNWRPGPVRETRTKRGESADCKSAMRSRSGGKNLRYGLEMAGLVGALMIGFVAFGPLQRAKAGLNRASILAEAEPSGAGKGSPEQKVTLTFNRDIAPIIFQHCAVCHRPGQSAPFSLLSYGDVKKQVKQVAEVLTNRFMPPGLRAKGYGEFAGDRR